MGSGGLGYSQSTKLTCLLVSGHTGVAESLSRLQIKSLMICNPITDPLWFLVSSWGASCPGQPSKPLKSEEKPVTVSHGLGADTVGAQEALLGPVEGSQVTVRVSLQVPGPRHSSC